MERIAAFVFASGGVVHQQELRDFFRRFPDVHTAVLADGFPSTSLKKIVVKVGQQHGLFWCDDDLHSGARGPVVVHEMTLEQQVRGAFGDEVQWVPRSLAALEQHVRALPHQKMSPGAIAQFYSAFPLEAAFMKRRCGGVAAFVAQYGMSRHGLSVDERGGVCARVQATDAVVATASHARADARAERNDSTQVVCFESAAEPEGEAAPWCSQSPASPLCSLLARKASLDRPTPSASSDHVRLGAAMVAPEVDTGVEAGSCSSALAALPAPSGLAVATTSLLFALPFELRALEQVSQMLSHVRAPPRLHPIAFAIVVFERQQQAKCARKTARQATRLIAATRLASGLEQVSHEDVLASRESAEQRVDTAFSGDECGDAREAATLVSATPDKLLPLGKVAVDVAVHSRSALVKKPELRRTSAWTLLLGNSASALEVTVASVLARVNKVLLSIRATPVLHPLAWEITLAHRMQQARRAMKTRSRSQAAPQLLSVAFRIVIPRATLEVLSCCAAVECLESA